MSDIEDIDSLDEILYEEDQREIVLRKSKEVAFVESSEVIEHLELRPDLIARECFEIIDLNFARRLKIVPVILDDMNVTIAMANPNDLVAMDDIRFKLPSYDITFASADQTAIDAALSRWSRTVAQSAEAEVVKEFKIDNVAENEVVEELSEESGRMSKLILKMLEQAVSLNASDVHIEPHEKDVIIRFRVDGVLQPHTKYPIHVANGIVNFFKVKGDMEVADRRRPQDGRFGMKISGREVDFRIVTIPTAHGPEGIVIRLFDQSRARLSIEELGFHRHIIEPLIKVLNNPHGMILVTGPTGSGKTTTLYGSLGLIATPDKKVLTVEDPVEIRFQGITQVQVNEEAQLTFATALKSFLRADPDIMLVGEIRDQETANLAAQAALTGHLVLSTLHTNEAAGAATRLVNLGLEPFIITSALKGVLAQRLIRNLCRNCAEPYEPTEEHLKDYNWVEGIEVPEMLWRANPNGCPNCDHTGYRGRLVVGELILVTDKVAQSILEMNSSSDIEKIAVSEEMKTLHYDAVLWAAEGKTSLEEIKRAGV